MARDGEQLVAVLRLRALAIIAGPSLPCGIDRIGEDARGADLFEAQLFPAVQVIWLPVLWRWFLPVRGLKVFP